MKVITDEKRVSPWQLDTLPFEPETVDWAHCVNFGDGFLDVKSHSHEIRIITYIKLCR